VVQAQAGHLSIESTRVYLHLANDWLATEYRRAAELIDAGQWVQIRAAAPQVAVTIQRYLQRLAAFLAPGSVDAAENALRQFARWMITDAGLDSTAAMTSRTIRCGSPSSPGRAGGRSRGRRTGSGCGPCASSSSGSSSGTGPTRRAATRSSPGTSRQSPSRCPSSPATATRPG
jgi:hypothetical protein